MQGCLCALPRKILPFFMTHYILDANGKPVVQPDLEKWAIWYETAKLLVGYTAVEECVIRTKFLGVSWSDESPHLWETKILGGKLDQVTDRCSGNWEQAQAMHARMVQRVNNCVSTDQNQQP